MSKIILIGGGSASGKTFVSRRLIDLVGSDMIVRISIDDYYKDLSNVLMEARKKINYDSPLAFDWPLLNYHLSLLLADTAIDKPIYDFTVHNRSKQTERVEPKPIIIVEGIMALIDPNIRSLASCKLFVSASPEKRLLRRLKRDNLERGRTYESIVGQYFAQVIPSFNESIGPSAEYADMIVNNENDNDGALDILLSYIKTLLEK